MNTDQDHRDIFGAESDEEPETTAAPEAQEAGDAGADDAGGDDTGDAPLPSVPRKEVNAEELGNNMPRRRKKCALANQKSAAG